MTRNDVLFVIAILGGIAAVVSLRRNLDEGGALDELRDFLRFGGNPGEAAAANPVSRSVDRTLFDDGSTVGTNFFDFFGPRPGDPAAANPISRSVDAGARAVTGAESGTLGTMLFDATPANVQTLLGDWFGGTSAVR